MTSEQLNIAYKSPNWYALRKTHIGGSDAGAILGLDKYRTQLDVWKEKTGKISKEEEPMRNAFMDYGTNAEAPLAKLFALDFPQYNITAPKNTVYINDYRMASLDLLIANDKGELGIGEIKTANDFGGKVRKQWSMNHIPDKYYAQILHYFATEDMFSFAVIMAYIKSQDGEMPYAETIYRTIRREDCLDDIEYLKAEEDKFMDCVKNNRKPNTKLFI